jgi:hypothetical protein
MTRYLLNKLLHQGLISPEQHAVFTKYEGTKFFSLSWELKSFLYLGVVLFSSGVGLLIYEHIDTIGHQVIIASIAVISFACFYYAYRNQPPFSNQLITPSTPFASYILLLGCLTFLTLEGYLQIQYTIFGTHYGLATFIPAIVFFIAAYYFDHRGVLSMALTALASWVGVSVTPLNVLENNGGFAEPTLIYTAVLLGAIIIGTGLYLDRKEIKRHFTFSYLNFGANLLFIACLAGLFTLEGQRALFAATLAGLCLGFIRYARREQAFFFLLIAVLYGYIGFTYLVFLSGAVNDFGFAMLYFLLSCGAVIYFFLHYKKLLKGKNQ